MTVFKNFLKKNTVLCIALIAATVTCFFIPPDSEYLGYFDFRVLTCLFCVLAVVCSFQNISFFYILARKIVEFFQTVRMCVLAIVMITFIGSMLIANDMALLTFLPLGFFVLDATKMHKYMAFTFTMQNIAANLGGMLTPFGNPQNLYLYSRFNIPNGEFFSIMLFPFCISTVLIIVCCLFVKPEKMKLPEETVKLDVKKAVIYSILFAVAIAVVFRSIPYYYGLIIIIPVLLMIDSKSLLSVDYPLLCTFAAFFVFSGNLARIGAVRDFLQSLLSKNTFLFSVASCQCISNVPSAILLSAFTDDYASLLRGVNIGGVGTFIASLASLITLREYSKRDPGGIKRYILTFSLLNFGFLLVLCAAVTIFI